MKVYRIEDENGIGPYRGKKWPKKSEMDDRHSISYSKQYRPTIVREGFKNCPQLYGCATLHNLKKWFLGYLGPMRRAGFQVFEYEVRSADTGKCFEEWGQVAFQLIDVLNRTPVPWSHLTSAE